MKLSCSYKEQLSKITEVDYLNALPAEIFNDLSLEEIDAIRQTEATLAIEKLKVNEEWISEIKCLIKGEISRERFQKKIMEKYQMQK